MKYIAIKLIEFYQNAGGGHSLFMIDCNFDPTCSEYMKLAIIKYGLFNGLAIGLKRIRRCNDPDLLERKKDPIP